MTETSPEMVYKSAWLEIKDRRVLFARTKGLELFYTAGGKREKGETDEEALIREIREELGVELVPESIKLLESFIGPAHNRPGKLVELKCFRADYKGSIGPHAEIEELAWFSSDDMHRTTLPGQKILSWLKEKDLID
jgi:8-oxo-dGTP pyrophosphatase MutT (NUDIX family)